MTREVLTKEERKSKMKLRQRSYQYRSNQSFKRNIARLEALSVLSKRLSNSDVPCCNCCGIVGFDFLDIDHIQGRIQMNSIKELTDIGYSSAKLYNNYKTIRWLKDHNYLEHLDTYYFQVLCKNCNGAKFLSNNNTCPHKNGKHSVDTDTIISKYGKKHPSIYSERKIWDSEKGIDEFYKDHEHNMPRKAHVQNWMEMIIGQDFEADMKLCNKQDKRFKNRFDVVPYVYLDLAVGDIK